MSDPPVTIGPVPGQALLPLGLAVLPGGAIAFAICRAAGIDDLGNEGFAIYVGVVAALTLLLWLGCRVRFERDELVVRRMWIRRRIPWSAVVACEFVAEPGPAGESNDDGALDWLSVRRSDRTGRAVGLLPILGFGEHGRAHTLVGRRTERLVARALAELHARGVPIVSEHRKIPLTAAPAVRALWRRTGFEPDTGARAAAPAPGGRTGRPARGQTPSG
jgi:hypothetical protein